MRIGSSASAACWGETPSSTGRGGNGWSWSAVVMDWRFGYAFVRLEPTRPRSWSCPGAHGVGRLIGERQPAGDGGVLYDVVVGAAGGLDSQALPWGDAHPLGPAADLVGRARGGGRRPHRPAHRLAIGARAPAAIAAPV